MQPYPRAPDLVWPGHLHGAGCLSAWAVGTGFPTVGLRWWLGPGCGWSWVLFSPARRGWGLGWVCLGSVCGVVPLLPAVCGVRGWALVSARFRDVCGFVRVSLAPRRGVGVRAGPGSRLCPALLGWVVGVCFFFFSFVFFFFRLLGVPVPGLLVSPPVSFLFGWAAGFFFFFFFCLFRCPFSRWAVVPGLVLPVFAGWSPCACLGVLSSVLSGGGVWPPFVFLAGGLVAVGSFRAAPLSPPPFFFFFLGGGGAGGGGGLTVSPFAFPRLALALWLVCGVVGPSPLLAEVPVCYSPPLLAGFRCRWWWAVPATPGWGPLAAVVCGVWCVAVVCWWGCGWCVVWLVPRHSWRRFLCATPRHSWLGFAGGGGVWCVVCGVWRWCVVGVVVGVCCGWSLATPGGGPCVLLPATPGWVSLAAVVCGVWCVVCGGGVLLGLWLVCGVVGPSPLLAGVPVCYSPPLLAGFRCRWRWAFPATPGWGPLAAVVCGVWCVVCGGGVLLGLWLVCGVVGPSPLLAEVPVCYSPPLLAGFRCRWWWAVPATPGWGPLAAVVCGVWCVAVVCWWGCGWCVVWLVPRHSWRRFLCATPRHSWLGFAGGGGVWCVVCGVWRWCVVGVVVGVWCGWSLATPGGGPCVLLPATPGWVSLAAVVCGVWCVVCGGGVLLGLWLVCGVVGPSPLLAEVPVCYSPPLLAGFRCRWRWAFPATPGWGPLAAVVCGVWCVAVVCWWGCGWCVVWLVPRHSWRRFLCATPRHSWLGFAGGGGVWCVVCGVWRWCVVGVVVGVWCGWSLATPGGGPCVLLPATPGWVSLAAVVCGVWCVVCGGGVLLGLWLVCGVVGPSPLLAEVPVCYSPPLLAGFRCRWRWAATLLAGAVVCGVWCVVCGGGVLLGLWLVCGVVGPSPLLAEVPVCYSPPLLAGFRCRWWWAAPATPGWGPLAAVVCGVWCVVCGGGVLLGLWLVCGGGVLLGLWLVCGVVGPSPVLAEVPVCYSPPLLAGFRCRWWWAVPATPGWGPLAAVVCGVWCVVCGGGVLLGLWLVCGGGVLLALWLVCGVVGPSPLLAEVPVCYSPPLLAGFRCRWWWAVPATPGWGPLAAVACGVCSCACFAWPGRAGRPPGRVLVRVTFSFGRFVFLLCLAPSGPGLPLSLSLLLPFLVGCFSRPPAAWLSVRSRLVCVSRLAVGCSLVVAPPPPSPFVSRGFRRSCLVPSCFFFFFFFSSFFFFLCAPPLSLVCSGFRPRVPWASALAVFALFAFGFSALRALVALSCFPPGCWLLPRGCCPPPPPLCVSRFSFLPLVAVCRVVLCFPGCGAAPRCCALCRPVFCCRVLCCARVVPLLVAPCPLALPVALGPCALRHCVLRCSPALCALCCVCFVVAPWCVLLFAALPCAVCVSGCCAVRSLCSPFCAVLCFAVLVRSCCAVRVVRAAAAGAWCCGALLCVVLFPVVCRGAVLGLVARGCLLVACFGVGVPVWPRGLLPCGWCGLLWCPAFLCRVLWCCAVAWCCAVVLCRRVAVLLGLALPSCGLSCCAVLCCWLAVVSARCGALFLVLCVPCLLRSVRCVALLCWLWYPASLCRVLWRCAVVWCCAVVLCCRFAVLFVLALPSCGLSCGASVVCAVIGASCCGVSLCVVVSPWAFCGGGAALVCRGVLLCCALSCGVLRPVPRPAVPCCPAVLCCLFFLLSSFPLLKTPAVFPCL